MHDTTIILHYHAVNSILIKFSSFPAFFPLDAGVTSSSSGKHHLPDRGHTLRVDQLIGLQEHHKFKLIAGSWDAVAGEQKNLI